MIEGFTGRAYEAPGIEGLFGSLNFIELDATGGDLVFLHRGLLLESQDGQCGGSATFLSSLLPLPVPWTKFFHVLRCFLTW
jgi:hypothetical protein